MEFWLQKGEENKIQLPVKPSDFMVSVSHKNTVVNVIKLGDINLIGKTGLREITLSSFFPAKDYNFSNNSDRKAPVEYVETLEKWRNSGKPIRVIITDTLNMQCTIESFSWGEQDATGDIYYSIALKEHKKIKAKTSTADTTPASTSSSASSTREVKTSTAGGTYTVKKGDTLWKIAKQYYGDGSKYMLIYNANSKKLSNPNTLSIGTVLTIPAYNSSTASSAPTQAKATSGTYKGAGGSKTAPPFAILTNQYGIVRTNITTWNEAYGYYMANGGSGKGWKIVDKDKNVVEL